MVIIIKLKYEDLYKAGTKEQISAFLEILANQIRDGSHVFLNDSDLFSLLSEDENISIAARSIYRTHSKNSRFLGEYFNYPVKTIIVCEDADWDVITEDKSTKFNLTNLIDNLEISFAITGSSIVFENISEDKIYTKIFENVACLKKFHGRIKYTPVHGGGNDTHLISAAEMTKTHNTFCICDSDKKHNNAPIGQTARLAKRQFDKSKRSHHIHIIDVHEIENLLPVQLYKNIAKNEQLKSVEILEFASNASPEHLLCYDIKESHEYKKIYTENSEFSIFWREFYNSPELLDHVELASKEYNSGKLDVKMSPRLSGLCKPVKDYFCESPNNFQLNKYLQREWEDIFERINAWCAATPPIKL